ncbi:MAG TPA: methyltransferase domain-containing protein [Patescibacteria group bacterium]|nr:methyltransferase domain-containing protein [Patescibacteria group bacterium]
MKNPETVKHYQKIAADYDRLRYTSLRQKSWDRSAKKIFLDFADEISGKSVLDLGCGTGRICQLFQGQGAQITGVDAASAMIRQAKNKVPSGQFVQADITKKIPFPDKSFDRVTASQVLPHLQLYEINFVLNEAKRLLDQNGILIADFRNIYSPLSFWAKIKAKTSPANYYGTKHYPLYLTPHRIRQIINKAGGRILCAKKIDLFASSIVYKIVFDQPQRICFLSLDSPHNTFTDGFISYLNNLADAFVSAGKQVMVVGFSRKVEKEQVVKKNGIIFWCFPDRNYSAFVKNLLLIKFIFRYRTIKANFSPDILHGQGGYAWPLIFIKKTVRVATVHGPQPFWQTPSIEKNIRTVLGRFVYPRLDGLIFISQAVKTAAEQFYPKIKKIPRQVVYPGIKLPDKFTSMRRKQDKIKIVSAGRLESIKNFGRLVKAFEIVKVDQSSIDLKIYGEGSLKKELGRYAKGALPHDELLHEISHANLFILPSYSEGIPNVVLEAFSLSVPVIIANWQTASELVTDNKSGYIINGNPTKENIALALRRAITSIDSWPKIASAGENIVKMKFDSTKNLQVMLDFYNTIITKCP